MPDENDEILETGSGDSSAEKKKNTLLPHIAMQVFNTPLMIHPQKLEVILKILGDRVGLDGDGIQITTHQADEMAKTMKSVARPPAKSNTIEIAVVPIIGTLVHRTGGFDSWSGLRSYQKIEKDFMAAVDDPKISAIFLDIDSPGGSVSGVFDLADKIYEANQKKPVYAFANEAAFSAAYLLGSSAGKIFMPRTGGVGSIGVRMVHVDMTERDKKEGLKVTNLYVGERKIDFDPHSSLSKEARELAMKDLNTLYDMFVETVARNRNVSAADVKATEAGVYLGNQAVKIGLADEIMTFDEAIEFIVDDVAERKKSTGTKASAQIEREVAMYKTLAELKEGAPDIYTQLVKEVEAELKASFDNERNGLENQLSDVKGELKEARESIKKLEKADYIRTQSEIKTRVATVSDKIWTVALTGSDIPESMHAKVRGMISANDFVKDGALDEESFQKAVETEISDWEGKGMTASVLGSGFGRKDDGNDDPDVKAAKEQEADDEEWVKETLALGGQKEEGGDK